MAGSKRKKYMKVFVALIVLTVLELGVVKMGLGRGATISALVGLALAKAAAVALWYMHLSDESKVLRWIVATTLLSFPPLYALALIAEAVFRGNFVR